MKEKWCTRHLTNSLSNQPDDDDADDVDVAALACCLWGLAAGDLVYGLCCPLPVKLQTPQYDSAMMLTMMMLMMTMMILVGEGKGCTRHLTNSLSTQPDDDDVDDVGCPGRGSGPSAIPAFVHGRVTDQRCSRSGQPAGRHWA